MMMKFIEPFVLSSGCALRRRVSKDDRRLGEMRSPFDTLPRFARQLLRANGFKFAALCLALIAVAGSAHAITIERVVSKGGIEAWLVQDRMVPLISVSFAWRGGAALDPSGKEGLAQMAAGTMDEGAGDLDAAAFKRALEDISASVGYSAEEGRLRLRALEESPIPSHVPGRWTEPEFAGLSRP